MDHTKLTATLFSLVAHGNLAKVQGIITSHPRILRATDCPQNLYTPLHVAVVEEQYEVGVALVHAGASVAARDVHGRTPLHLLAMCVDASTAAEELLVELLNFGCDIDVADHFGRTPLMVAAESSALRTTLSLLTRPELVNVNAQDNQGNTALHYAAREGNVLIARALFCAECDERIVNFDLNTPTMLAHTRAFRAYSFDGDGFRLAVHPLYRVLGDGSVDKAPPPDADCEHVDMQAIRHEEGLEVLNALPASSSAPLSTVMSTDTGVVVRLHVVLADFGCFGDDGDGHDGNDSGDDSPSQMHTVQIDSEAEDGEEDEEGEEEAGRKKRRLFAVDVMIIADAVHHSPLDGTRMYRGYALLDRELHNAPGQDINSMRSVLAHGQEVWFADHHVFAVDVPQVAWEAEFVDIARTIEGVEGEGEDHPGSSLGERVSDIAHRVAVYHSILSLMQQYGYISVASIKEYGESWLFDSGATVPQQQTELPGRPVVCSDLLGSSCVVQVQGEAQGHDLGAAASSWGGLLGRFVGASQVAQGPPPPPPQQQQQQQQQRPEASPNEAGDPKGSEPTPLLYIDFLGSSCAVPCKPQQQQQQGPQQVPEGWIGWGVRVGRDNLVRLAGLYRGAGTGAIEPKPSPEEERNAPKAAAPPVPPLARVPDAPSKGTGEEGERKGEGKAEQSGGGGGGGGGSTYRERLAAWSAYCKESIEWYWSRRALASTGGTPMVVYDHLGSAGICRVRVAHNPKPPAPSRAGEALASNGAGEPATVPPDPPKPGVGSAGGGMLAGLVERLYTPRGGGEGEGSSESAPSAGNRIITVKLFDVEEEAANQVKEIGTLSELLRRLSRLPDERGRCEFVKEVMAVGRVSFPSAGAASILTHFSSEDMVNEALVAIYPCLIDKHNFEPVVMRMVAPDPIHRLKVLGELRRLGLPEGQPAKPSNPNPLHAQPPPPAEGLASFLGSWRQRGQGNQAPSQGEDDGGEAVPPLAFHAWDNLHPIDADDGEKEI